MSKLLKRILLGLLIVIVGIQFIRPSRSVPPSNPQSTFEALNNPPAEIVDLMEVACYDCHTHQTEYPWYANVAPVSWWIGNHISEGRDHFNMTLWGKYNLREKIHKLEEAAEEVNKGHMPENSYTWMHKGAKLSDAQRNQLVVYFTELKEALQSIPPRPGMPPAPGK